jgi:outer membrane lipoprotein-sorting protein
MPANRRATAALLLVALCVPGLAAHAADPLTAREIMQRVEDREEGDDSVARVTIAMTDRFGDTHECRLKRFRKDAGPDGKDSYTFSFIDSPEAMQGTRTLTLDYRPADAQDDQWLYIPALGEVKRITTNTNTSRLMGSDITYGDLTSRDLDLYEFELLGEEPVEKWRTWVVSFKPKTPEEIRRFGYTHGKVWVEQNSYVVVRSIFWMAENEQVKYFITHDLREIDGIWSPVAMTFITRKGAHTVSKTTMRLDDIAYDVGLPDAMFTPDYLTDPDPARLWPAAMR